MGQDYQPHMCSICISTIESLTSFNKFDVFGYIIITHLRWTILIRVSLKKIEYIGGDTSEYNIWFRVKTH